jgi:cyclic pyranopterin phosphate synthase
MPFGEEASVSSFVPVEKMRQCLKALGTLEPCSFKGNGPAKYFRLPEAHGTIGFITPVSEHFCFHCNRLRLTADGKLRPCLLSEVEIDLKQPLRSGISSAKLERLIKKAADSKPLQHQLAKGRVPRDRNFSQVGG